jgi:hypothetical protein
MGLNMDNIRGENEHPPSEINEVFESEPLSIRISLDRDNRCTDYLFSGSVCRQGRLLNRSLSLLNKYNSMGD